LPFALLHGFGACRVIIFRYLSKDILVSACAVCFALLMIFLSSRFVGLLADAAAGKYSVDVLFIMIGYRMPGFLQIILPLGFYIAILLAYGRLYMESEMVVLSACGMSQRQLMAVTMVPAAVVALFVALFSFWLSPLGSQNYARVLDEQRNRSDFESLNAGRFQSLGQGGTISYVDQITNSRKRLDDVFIARASADKAGNMVVMAAYGEQIQHPEYNQRYLVLHDGYRYEGQPGTADFRVTKFSTYGQYMPPVEVTGDYTNQTDAKTTGELIASNDRSLRAALQWRISLPVMVFVVALLAVPLSRTNPRQGRYMKMLPAILVFVFYFIFLSSLRGAMENGKWPIYPGLWAVHAAFLTLGLVLFNWDNIGRWRRRRSAGGAANA
jgi:lipopolysaccharide export system permease protein